jgi:hypothetical protein
MIFNQPGNSSANRQKGNPLSPGGITLLGASLNLNLNLNLNLSV